MMENDDDISLPVVMRMVDFVSSDVMRIIVFCR